MKKSVIICVLTLLAMTQTVAQTTDKQAVTAVVQQFATAADAQDTKAISLLLDDNFRVVVNRLFGSDKVAVLTKETYLAMMADKKLGGDKSEVQINSLEMQGNNAMVNTLFTGAKMKMQMFLHLVKNSEGEWKIVDDLPAIVE